MVINSIVTAWCFSISLYQFITNQIMVVVVVYVPPACLLASCRWLHGHRQLLGRGFRSCPSLKGLSSIISPHNPWRSLGPISLAMCINVSIKWQRCTIFLVSCTVEGMCVSMCICVCVFLSICCLDWNMYSSNDWLHRRTNRRKQTISCRHILLMWSSWQ